MIRILRDIYDSLIEFLRTFGAFQLFFLRLLRNSPMHAGPTPATDYQTDIQRRCVVAGHYHGLRVFRRWRVLGLLGHNILAQFNAEDAIGTLVAFALIKQLGPVFTALLFAGRAGTALSSEIGLMKATDQLSAMEMMAVNPLRRVLVPRFLGGCIAMPMLVAIFICVGLFGAHLVTIELLQVDAGAFWEQMRAALVDKDIREFLYKSVAFGVVASLIAVWEGYNAVPTAEGVGRATTRAVVITAISVLILNFMITAVML